MRIEERGAAGMDFKMKGAGCCGVLCDFSRKSILDPRKGSNISLEAIQNPREIKISLRIVKEILGKLFIPRNL